MFQSEDTLLFAACFFSQKKTFYLFAIEILGFGILIWIINGQIKFLKLADRDSILRHFGELSDHASIVRHFDGLSDRRLTNHASIVRRAH